MHQATRFSVPLTRTSPSTIPSMSLSQLAISTHRSITACKPRLVDLLRLILEHSLGPVAWNAPVNMLFICCCDCLSPPAYVLDLAFGPLIGLEHQTVMIERVSIDFLHEIE